MNESRISVRYARALFETALERDTVEETGRDMRFILDVSRIPEFRALISNPVIPLSKKTKIFHAAFSGHLNPLTSAMADLVISKGREPYLAQIARNFLKMSREHLGITEVVLTTAVKPGNEIKENIKKIISARFNTKIDLMEVVKPDIIGGFVLRLEDKLIDASVRAKLKVIAKEMT
jgi:F-type H+-transporting ATPase subunit delta